MTLIAWSFSQPWAWWGLALLPVLVLLHGRAESRNRQQREAYANPSALKRLTGNATNHLRLQAALGLSAWLATVTAVASPTWGFDEDVPVVRERDLVLVLDMSNSMRARDTAPSRFEAARNAASRLVDHLRSRPGFRVGVVAFAADAQIVCPLTEDLEFVQSKLRSLSFESPPPYLRVKAHYTTGTSFVAAIQTALLAHDPRMAGFQDILLLSDGDDPAELATTQEALQLIEEARTPCYTVGVGDPEKGDRVRIAGREEPITTRFQSYPLVELARRSQGAFLAAGMAEPDLVPFFQYHIEPKDRTVPPGYIPPQPVSRHVWFYALAGVLWLGHLRLRSPSLAIGPLGHHLGQRLRHAWQSLAQRIGGVGLAKLILGAALIAAEPRIALDWERLGDQAIAERRYQDAAAAYRQAQERTSEPTRVAYKLGVACFHAGDYREAERWFRATVATTQGEDQAKSWYNLGTCLLHRSDAQEASLLEEAVVCFENCLHASPNELLQADARRNLELAKLLRLRSMAKQRQDRQAPGGGGRTIQPRLVPADSPKTPASTPSTPADRDPAVHSPSAPISSGPEAGVSSSRPPLPGATQRVLPTLSEVAQPLSPADARAEVRRAMERIARERAKLVRPRLEEPQSYPDW